MIIKLLIFRLLNAVPSFEKEGQGGFIGGELNKPLPGNPP